MRRFVTYNGYGYIADQSNKGFKDFTLYDGVGTEAQCQLTTGFTTGGDTVREKFMPYLMVSCRTTEFVLEEVAGGGMSPQNPSSCKCFIDWDWNANRLGSKRTPEFQAYKAPVKGIAVSSGYIPQSFLSQTKTRVRGQGRSFTVTFKSEPDKDLILLGWAILSNINALV